MYWFYPCWPWLLPVWLVYSGITFFQVPLSFWSDTTEVETIDEYQAYMKDCMEVAEYSMFECKKLWNDRGEKHTDAVDFKPASDVKLLDTDNQEYKARRASVVGKPDAVVMQATYR